ncbi:MAG: hypothetical protein ACI81L_002093 [Verrucomicrobiales bacterium]|jgi:hypothetical protein
MAWCESIAPALDLEIDETLAVREGSPLDRRRRPGIAFHICSGLYLDRPPAVGTRRESLLNLAGLDGLDSTAFATMYGDRDIAAPKQPVEALTALRPLSLRQEEIARHIRNTELSVISGAPGTGKSHLVSAIALDAVSRGQSVLVAAGSPHAVDVLVEQFANAPGPTPVAFGGSVHGNRLAMELSELASRNEGRTTPRSDDDEHQDLVATANQMLEAEKETLRLARDPGRRVRLSQELERAGDLRELEQILRAVSRSWLPGWLARRRYGDEISSRLGRDQPPEAQLAELQRVAHAQHLSASGGLTLAPTFDALVEIEGPAAAQRGLQVTEAWLEGLNPKSRRSLAEISAAVSSSRSARRFLLGAIDPKALTRAAPLWVGSVRDIDAVLPVVAGLFDLVILDEASQIDLLTSANALVRAKRAIVCGDPAQLGHVSFLSDAAIAAATEANGTDPNILNPRKRSTFDYAAGRVPTHVLDEHFRSVPHLIEFSARQIYANTIHVASRHPSNEAADHIHVHHVTGARGPEKVNIAEVEKCLSVAGQLIDDGWDSIGFISPFRAQADALESAILEKFRLDEIEHHGLRVGTVHGFQGDERRVMIASWAIGEDEGPGAWRFVNQRNLFNVMVTRAREQMVVVTSTPNPPGLAGEYLRWSEPLANLLRDIDLPDPWVKRVADAVEDAGISARIGYSVGRYFVDLVVGSGPHALAVDCSPHGDGPAVYIDRALQLRRAGWRTTGAFQSRWADDVGELAIELAGMYSEMSERSS